MTQPPHVQQPPAFYPPPQQPARRGSGLAIAALVLGIIGLLLSWIPIVNYVAIVLGLVGLALGIVGIFKSHRVLSIVGSVLSLLAIVVSVIAFSLFATAVDEAISELDDSASIDGGAVEGGGAALDAEADANADADADADAATNARGNIVTAPGEEGGISDDSGADLLTFTVDSIAVDAACTSDWQEYGTPVEPGRHLVSVQLRVTTSPAVTDDDFLTLGGYDFKYIGTDGITVDTLASEATYGCLADDEQFTSDTLGPGQTYVGAVVLDVPAASGTLVLDPSWGQSGGWEYSF